MAMDPLGAAVTAGSGILSFIGARDANQKNAEQAALNRQMQEDFAQRGIRWKVKDARAAGIHPLYALGAQTTSFSPVTVGATNEMAGPAAAMASLGQDLSRSVNATRTMPERLEATALTKLQLEGLAIDNDIKRATLASSLQRLQQNSNPPIPTVGPFVVPEAGKAEERQPLMLDGNRVLTDPGTSPGKAWEDQLGDDIFSPGFLPNLWGMIKRNTDGMSFIDILRAIDRKTQVMSGPSYRPSASGGRGW